MVVISSHAPRAGWQRMLPNVIPRNLCSYLLTVNTGDARDAHIAICTSITSIVRKQLYYSVAKAQVRFPCVVHKTGIVSPTANMGVGCLVGLLVLINTNASLGDFCLVNSAAILNTMSVERLCHRKSRRRSDGRCCCGIHVNIGSQCYGVG